MRTSSIFRHHAIFGMVMLIVACSKEPFQRHSSATEVHSQRPVVTLSLVGSSWVHNGTGIYTNTFTDILKPFNTGSSSIQQAGVFLPTVEVDISRSQLNYQGGVLDAEINNNDVIITYHSLTDRIPFRSLDITLVIISK